MKNIALRVASGDIVETNLTEYGRYVAEDRALANLYDGLKPVQRRILWTVWERLKLRPGSTSKRSARVAGECTGVFHPHGDASTYGSLVTLTWQRYPLLQGHGNFGNPPVGMPPAAARYTAVLASDILPEVFRDQVVAEMDSNYSGEFEEPVILPARLPSLLMNGSEGIAVGVSANIPAHNLTELIRALRALLRRQKPPPSSEIKKAQFLMRWIKGPDPAEGGVLLSDREAVRNLYAHGHGTLEYRCAYRIDKVSNGHTLTVTSACPRWTIPKFVEQCQQLVADGGLGWVENQSGQQIKVVCYARDSSKLEENVVPLLTRSVRYNWIALGRDKEIIEFNLWGYLTRWIDYRREVVEKHLQYEVEVTRRRLEAEEAKLRAAQNLDRTIEALREKDPVRALKRTLEINDHQAQIILKASIRTLTRRGETKQLHLVSESEQYLNHCMEWLSDIDGRILAELEALKSHFDGRRTEVEQEVSCGKGRS